MKLSVLLQDLVAKNAVLPNLNISHLTENSSQVHENTLFVCICGARANGHHFAADAYAKGCRTFVVQEPVSLPSDAYVLKVADTRIALSQLACRFYGNPSRKMHVIGITGTKGKTTTALLLFHILNAADIPCGYIGTNGIFYAEKRLPTKNSTPDAVTLQSALYNMSESGVKTAVIEVSSQALMQHRADGTHFETILFTNLFPDHIGVNEHPNIEHYKACKHRLFTDFEASRAIYNADDSCSAQMLQNSSVREKISCSADSPTATFFADAISVFKNRTSLGVSFTLHHNQTAAFCTLPFIGKFNAYNALLALATAHTCFGIPLTDAICALQNTAVDGRSEILPLANGATAIIDYAHNGASLRALLTVLKDYSPRRLIALFGSVGGRSQMRRAEMGAVAAELCDFCILTSDNPGEESPDAIIADIARPFANRSTPYRKIIDRREAIEYAVSIAEAGDILVLAGKGQENYQFIGQEKLPFSEKQILSKYLLRQNAEIQ